MGGFITDVKRFAVHDGDGIRTTVFFKGCPLSCVWCHNPEGIRAKTEIAFYQHKCVGCTRCISVCKSSAHLQEGDGHSFNRDACALCGDCASVCRGEAISILGRYVEADELIPLLTEDKCFYESSGGGVTLSGGECLMQADFCKELLSKLKQSGINTAIDTCGAVAWSAFESVIPFTDVLLYDIKAIDEQVHKRCTGVTNKLILENLLALDAVGSKIEIRIPYVPGYNAGEIPKIADFIKRLKNVTKIKVLPYHNFAGTKYEALGIPNNLPKTLPTPEEIAAAQKLFDKVRKLS